MKVIARLLQSKKGDKPQATSRKANKKGSE
jgi:hypothetical protein